MNETYGPISLDDITFYRSLLSQTSSYASDYSFGNLWGWAPHFGLEYRYDGQLCWIKQKYPETVYWAPIGPWEAVTEWFESEETTSGQQFIRIPENLLSIWKERFPDKIVSQESRGDWDYIYLSSDLSSLSGNRFHKKKNLLKQFQKTYDYTYLPITHENAEMVLDMQAEWCRWRDCDSSRSLLAENDAISRLLAYWEKIPGLMGGIISIDDQPVAYTLAEPLGEDTLIVHFEKGHNSVKGVYQAINWLFCNDRGVNYKYLNREQDLGDEGLRQAKLSYNPVTFEQKHTVKFL